MTTQKGLSPKTVFGLTTNMYKHVYRDFAKDEKKKSQYQDTICSEAEEGRRELEKC